MLIQGHEFEFLRTVPYTRKDGTGTFIGFWSTQCAHPGCEACWEVSCPVGDDPSQHPPTHVRFPNSHTFSKKFCKDHKPRRKAAVKRNPDQWRKMDNNRRSKKLSDDDVVRIRMIAHELRSAGMLAYDVCEALTLEYPVTAKSLAAIICNQRRKLPHQHPNPPPPGYPYNLPKKEKVAVCGIG